MLSSGLIQLILVAALIFWFKSIESSIKSISKLIRCLIFNISKYLRAFVIIFIKYLFWILFIVISVCNL